MYSEKEPTIIKLDDDYEDEITRKISEEKNNILS